MMRADRTGLYVHIPFCLKKCNYCDFCSSGGASREEISAYIDALISEAESYKRDEPIKVDTVFFGGGTPSILEGADFRKIMLALDRCFDISPDSEITVEANPKTLTPEKLLAYRECGVNRISIGLQSVHENEQKALGRVHNYEDFLESFSLCRKAGIDNINVDIMYAIPEQTNESLAETVERVIALSPEHISAYSLIVEEGTPFFENRVSLHLPDEDEECQMYSYLAHRLREAGYSHYEISNYAKEGYACRHNLVYWRAREYVGLGLSAHSYFGGSRYFNTDKMAEYLDGGRVNYRRGNFVSDAEREYEYAMLALRLREGLSLIEYKSIFNKDFREGREDAIAKFSRLGLMSLENDRLSFTERGFYLSNALLVELL